MIARLSVLLPFTVTIPEGEQFNVHEYIDEGVGVRVFPPVRSDAPLPGGAPDEIKIDDVPAFAADALRIDFHKESFSRDRGGPCDPSEQLLTRAVNSFLLRLRHVTRGASVHAIDFPRVTWRLQYLNDDETEFEKDEKLVRGLGTLHVSLNWVALNRAIWNDIHDLPPDYEPPPWEALLLDAHAELPSVGPAVVLAATALEVLIARALDGLATQQGLAPDLWAWINNRGNWLREPTVEEQYDALLKHFTGFSLKADSRLWETLMNLKAARNSFVHEGLAKIGGAPVSGERVQALVASAWEIVSKVRESLPPELRWPEFKYELKVQAVKRILSAQPGAPGDARQAARP